MHKNYCIFVFCLHSGRGKVQLALFALIAPLNFGPNCTLLHFFLPFFQPFLLENVQHAFLSKVPSSNLAQGQHFNLKIRNVESFFLQKQKIFGISGAQGTEINHRFRWIWGTRFTLEAKLHYFLPPLHLFCTFLHCTF